MPLLLRSEEHTSELQSPCNLVCLFCLDRKSTRLNSSHLVISYAVFCLKKKTRELKSDLRIAVSALTMFVCPGVTWCAPVVQLEVYRMPTGACRVRGFVYSFFFNDTATTEIYTLSLHDALPI